MSAEKSPPPAWLIYGIWLVIVVLSALAAWQLFGGLTYLAALWLENPAWRPLDWNRFTISGLTRLLVPMIGIFWLGFLTFSERYLRVSPDRQTLGRRTRRLVGVLAAVILLSYLIFWLF